MINIMTGKCYIIQCVSLEDHIKDPCKMCVTGKDTEDISVDVFCEGSPLCSINGPGICELRQGQDDILKELSEVDSIIFKLEYGL